MKVALNKNNINIEKHFGKKSPKLQKAPMKAKRPSADAAVEMRGDEKNATGPVRRSTV